MDDGFTKEEISRLSKRFKKLDKDNGTTDHVNHRKVVKGTDKLAFALHFKFDRDVSFLSVTESHAQINRTSSTMLKSVAYWGSSCCTRKT